MSRFVSLATVALGIVIPLAAAGTRAAEPVKLSAEPSPPGGPAIRLAGVVAAPDGKPIEGAAVVLRTPIGGQQYTGGLRHNRDVLARTTTDRDGRFDFGSVPIPPRFEEQIEQLTRGAGGAQVVAWADGFAVAWTEVPCLDNGEPLRLTLEPEAGVTGVVSDVEGRGMAGVRITARLLTRSASLDTTSRDRHDLNLTLSEVSLQSVSEAGGRFNLRNLPAECRIGVTFDARDHRPRFVLVDTAAEPAPMPPNDDGGPALPVLRSPVELRLTAVREIVVKIVDHEGQPVEGGAVQGLDEERRMAGWAALENGECRLAPRAAGKISLHYEADPLQPRLGGFVEVDFNPEAASQAEIRLPAPRWLAGRVVDADTGDGVAGAYVRYAHETDDSFGNKTTNSIAVSGADGAFKLPVAAGTGQVAFFFHPVHGYLPPTFHNSVDRKQPLPSLAIDVPVEGEIEPAKLILSRGLALRGVVRDGAGQPVPGAVVRGNNLELPFRRQTSIADAEGRYTLTGLSPHTEAAVTVTSDAGGALEIIPPEPNHPWDQTRWIDRDLKLEYGVVLFGRVMYQGKPRAGVRMNLSRSIGDKKNRYFPWTQIVTDADGKYRAAGLAPGDAYAFEVRDPEGLLALDWHHQMPYVQHVPEERPQIELPDVQLVSRRQSLRGVVVDPQGKPVPGVSVSASMTDGRRLSRPPTGPVPWTETDQDGRFELSQLPDEPIELMAYRANPKGGPIRFPAKMRPTLNQQDVRIVLDPSLTSEVEDLDRPKEP
jgi:protocatechuate 3,4-dioxygenase beta subunit